MAKSTVPQFLPVESFEESFAARIADFKSRWAALREEHADLPAYDVDILETDPVVIAAQSAAYRDIHLFEGINNAARAALLVGHAGGDVLDAHGAGDAVVRMDGEDDARFRQRLKLFRAGRSAAGPKEWWLYHAMTADVRVRDVGTEYLGRGVLEIAIHSTEDGGAASDDLLEIVREHLDSPSIRPDNVTIRIVTAFFVEVPVVARIWLAKGQTSALLDTMASDLRAAWSAQQVLGAILAPSWIIAQLHREGVIRVELDAPTATALVGEDRVVKIGTVDLTVAS